jgi:phosphoribosylformimino-5-aminoimidazole carboxamide ribotide isomerase
VTVLLPAIDLRAGQAVRLLQGDFEAETVYSSDPVEVAKAYEAGGAKWIHVVDLDAARTGEPVNLPLVAAIASAVGCALEVGGGVRSPEAAARLLDAGADRVVVGTAAVEEPGLVVELCRRHPGRVAAGLDAWGRRLAVRGWTHTTESDVVEAARQLEATGITALVVTEIGRDGTMAGADLDQLTAVLEATAVDVIASGGVGSLEDLRAVAAMRSAGRSLAGVIVGRALLEGRFTVEQAVEALACSPPG